MRGTHACVSFSCSCVVRMMLTSNSHSATKWRSVCTINQHNSVTSSTPSDPTSSPTAPNARDPRWTSPVAFRSMLLCRWSNGLTVHMFETTRCSSRSWSISERCRSQCCRMHWVWIRVYQCMFNTRGSMKSWSGEEEEILLRSESAETNPHAHPMTFPRSECVKFLSEKKQTLKAAGRIALSG